MIKILCFGDSNTYGYIPGGGGRYNYDDRYGGVLAALSGGKFEVSEDGLCGRTTVFDRGDLPGRRGIDSIAGSVSVYKPDILIIMLGTNDCKAQFGADKNMIADGIAAVAERAKAIKPDLRIIIISPVIIGNEALVFADYYNEESLRVSGELSATYKVVADKYGYCFLDAAEYASADHRDGEHLNAEGHKLLAESLYRKIIKIVGK